MTQKEHDLQMKLMDENYPKYILVGELIAKIELLKNIKKSRKTVPQFYFPDAEVVMKKRIKELKKAINIL